MRNDSGFTLIEVLVVIIILSILLIIAAPNILNSASVTKNKAYETKVAMIEDAAILYGQDNYVQIIENANLGISDYSKKIIDGITYMTQTIKVKNLVSSKYLNNEGTSGSYISDPRCANKYLDEVTVLIKINTNIKKVTAEMTETTC